MEFIIPGFPVSAQTRNRAKWEAWRQLVATTAQAALKVINSAPDKQWRRVVIVIVHEEDVTIDVDNVAKPILDGLKRVLVADDSQIDEMVVKRVRRGPGTVFRDPPMAIVSGLESEANFVYIRMDTGSGSDVLP